MYAISTLNFFFKLKSKGSKPLFVILLIKTVFLVEFFWDLILNWVKPVKNI